MKTAGTLTALLNDCAATCDHCAAACLQEAQVAHLTDCIRTDIACAAVCRTTAQLLEQGIAEKTALQLCAAVCKLCADECSKHDHDHCRACAAICTECAAECAQGAVS